VTFLPYALAAWVFLIGLFGVVTSRNLIHITVCVSVCQSSTYILLLAIGYRRGGTAPIFSDIPSKGRRTVDPVVQALTLTDIVVSVAVAALLLAFALKSFEHHDSLDPAEIAGLSG
jgi:multicomponent Na+:H+ antiporter subunit C